MQRPGTMLRRLALRGHRPHAAFLPAYVQALQMSRCPAAQAKMAHRPACRTRGLRSVLAPPRGARRWPVASARHRSPIAREGRVVRPARGMRAANVRAQGNLLAYARAAPQAPAAAAQVHAGQAAYRPSLAVQGARSTSNLAVAPPASFAASPTASESVRDARGS